MATLEDFNSWIVRDLSRFCGEENYVEWAERRVSTSAEDPPSETEKIRIYTSKNKYAITAAVHADDDDGYLGCIADSRMPRAGETWTRGRDLSDGDLNEGTWRKILADILSYEMVRVHPSEPKVTEVTEAA